MSMAQHFMDAGLIENATDRSTNTFKDKCIFMLTPKGLHILERFIARNGMTADHLVDVFNTQPICAKLLHIERRPADDTIIMSDHVVMAVFRRFAGVGPNHYKPTQGTSDHQPEPRVDYVARSKGIFLSTVIERSQQMIGKGTLQTFEHCFGAIQALEWLCAFTSLTGRDESAEMAAHFVRHGLIDLVHDKRRGGDDLIILSAHGEPINGAMTVRVHARLHNLIS